MPYFYAFNPYVLVKSHEILFLSYKCLKKSLIVYTGFCVVLKITAIIFTNYCHTKSWQYVQYLTYDHALFTKLFSFRLIFQRRRLPSSTFHFIYLYLLVMLDFYSEFVIKRRSQFICKYNKVRKTSFSVFICVPFVKYFVIEKKFKELEYELS